MKSFLWRIPAVLAGLALVAGVLAGSASGESRNRALERVVAKGMYSADEGARLQKAFAAALQAGVREKDALELVEACVSGDFDTGQILRVVSLAAQLALESLPIEGFHSKVEEGVAKRVAPDRVVQAAERRALALNQARLIFNSLVLQGVRVDDRDELLPGVAAALESGRAPDEVRAILAESLEAGESPGAVRRKLFP